MAKHQAPPMKKNDLVTLEITDLTPEGMGVGRHEGYVIFVPKTAVGDVITARILKPLASYAYGKTESILTASPDRQAVDCPVFAKCGGCLFRHIRYEAELRIKQGWVEENFRRIGGFSVPCSEILPSPSETGYRNKAQLPVGKGADGKPVFGFYAPNSHRIIPHDACELQPAFYSEIVKTVSRWMTDYGVLPYDEETHRGILRHLFLRDGRKSGEIMVTLVANADSLPHTKELTERLTALNQRIRSIILNINKKEGNEILGKKCITLFGKPSISDTLCGARFDISPLSFYQINHDGAERLYKVAAELAALSGKETLLDLYCGVGTIGLSMAKDVSRLIGVEVIPEAVENARKNAADNGITNAEFFSADAGEAAEKLAADGVCPDVIVVDPPRKGCDKRALDAILKMAPPRIVMVSCNSATAARDAAYLAENGYRLDALRPVDMFPRTGHVETVVLMSRTKP